MARVALVCMLSQFTRTHSCAMKPVIPGLAANDDKIIADSRLSLYRRFKRSDAD